MTYRLFPLLLLTLALNSWSQQKITLTPDMLINLSTVGNASVLINEQEACGDPKKGGNTYIPEGNFFGSHKSMYYPIQIVIDLKVEHQISDVFVFDTHNKDSLHFFSGSPDKLNKFGSTYLGGYNSWKSISGDVKSRYLMLEFPSAKANISELIIYGKALTLIPQAVKPTAHTPPFFEDLMGINGLHNQPIEKLQCVGSVREYHPWQWDEGNEDESYEGYPNNQFGWNPSWVGGKWPWDFDKTYQSFKNAGLDVSPCLQQNALYLMQDPEKKDWKPISEGANPENPASYKAHARYMYQFAARYGSTKVAASELFLEARNPKKSGLGLIRYMENWNEPDKWWRGREGYFSPFELAAMCSADYDGHEGKLGSGYGAKNADPNMQFVMGGLANLSLEYIRAMKLWSDTYRQSGFPADVINVHHYSNTSGGQNAGLKEAISPEADSLKYKLRELVEYRDRNLPGKEIWLSEFGYDTNPNSPQGVKAIKDYDELEVQGQWLVRSFLEIAAAGVDRAHVYFFADLNSKNPNKFNSSGVVNEKWFKFQPKTAWYYLYCLQKILTGYRFSSEVITNQNGVNVYKFENPNTASCTYAIWCNTSSGQTIANFKLAVDGSNATLLELNPTETTPKQQSLPISNKEVSLPISERPVFVKIN